MIARRLAVAGIGLPALWATLGSVLAVDRGFGAADEGWYLLAADPPSRWASWGFPFGWFTAPLFRLVGFSVPAFRTLGAVLLACSFLAVALAATSPSRRVRLGRSSGNPTNVLLLLAVIAVASSLVFYRGFLRTPGYNWLNLLGSTLVLASFLSILWLPREQLESRTVRYWLAISSVSAAGLLLTLPAKPSTAPMLFPAVAIATVIVHGRSVATRFVGGTIVGVAAMTGVLLATGIWPVDFVARFLAVVQTPPLSPNHTLSGAASSALRIPAYPLYGVTSRLGVPAPALWSTAALIGMFAALAFLIRGTWRGTKSYTRVVRLVVMLLATGGVFVAGVPLPWMDSAHGGGWAWPPLLTGCAMIGLAAVTWALVESRPSREIGLRLVLSITVSLVAIAAHGFGSALELYPNAAQSAGLLPLMGSTAIVATMTSTQRARRALVVVAGATVLVAGAAVLQSKTGEGGVDVSVVREVPVGIRGETLLIQEPLAGQLLEFRSEARGAGLTDSTPIVGVEYPWSSTTIAILGARPPDSLMLGILDHANGTAVAAHLIREEESGFPWESAWVVTSNPSSLEPEPLRRTRFVLDALSSRTGRAFPSDYRLRVEVGDLQLWQPIVD